jgi:hypothetical protein
VSGSFAPAVDAQTVTAISAHRSAAGWVHPGENNELSDFNAIEKELGRTGK